jgi:hypothetical protein
VDGNPLIRTLTRNCSTASVVFLSIRRIKCPSPNSGGALALAGGVVLTTNLVALPFRRDENCAAPMQAVDPWLS